MEEDIYPNWLADKLFNNKLDWKTATSTTLEKLLTHVTLHDSGWYNTVLTGADNWVLVIQLDAIWNKEFCHQLTDWPFLLVKFKQVLCSCQDLSPDASYGSIISDAETTALTSSSFTEWMNLADIANLLPVEVMPGLRQSQDLQRTRISTIYGGSLTLIHKPAVELLLYTDNGMQLAIELT